MGEYFPSDLEKLTGRTVKACLEVKTFSVFVSYVSYPHIAVMIDCKQVITTTE